MVLVEIFLHGCLKSDYCICAFHVHDVHSSVRGTVVLLYLIEMTYPTGARHMPQTVTSATGGSIMNHSVSISIQILDFG